MRRIRRELAVLLIAGLAGVGGCLPTIPADLGCGEGDACPPDYHCDQLTRTCLPGVTDAGPADEDGPLPDLPIVPDRPDPPADLPPDLACSPERAAACTPASACEVAGCDPLSGCSSTPDDEACPDEYACQAGIGCSLSGPTVEAPVLEPWPCSGGWTADTWTSGNLSYLTCNSTPTVSCGGIQVPRATAGCGFIGGNCDAGSDFPRDIPDAPGGAIFVAVQGTGPGTRESPFGTIQEGLDASSPDGVVVVGLGQYAERVVMPPWNLLVLGACAGATLIKNPSPATGLAVVLAGGAQHTVKNLTVDAREVSFGIRAVGGGQVELDGVLVSGASDSGLRYEGPDGLLSDVKVDGELGLGSGLEITAGHVTATRLVVSQARLSGIDVLAGLAGAPPLLDGSDIWVLSTRAASRIGYGLRARSGAAVNLQRLVLGPTEGVGVKAENGAQLTLTDAIIRDTTVGLFGAIDGEPVNGQGLVVTGVGTRAEVTRLFVERNRVAGVFAGRRAELELTDAVILDTDRGAGGSAGHGLAVQGGARVTVERAFISTHAGAGVLAGVVREDGAVASVDLADVVITDSQAGGVALLAGSTGSMTRSVVTANGGPGVAGHGGGLTVGASALRCSAEQLDLVYATDPRDPDGNPVDAVEPIQTATNRCGCGHLFAACQVQGLDLTAPRALAINADP